MKKRTISMGKSIFKGVTYQDVLVMLGFATIVFLSNADTAFAKEAKDFYLDIKAGITGIWGALFSICAAVIGLVEYNLNGKNLSHLLAFIIVALFPHLAVVLIEKMYTI